MNIMQDSDATITQLCGEIMIAPRKNIIKNYFKRIVDYNIFLVRHAYFQLLHSSLCEKVSVPYSTKIRLEAAKTVIKDFEDFFYTFDENERIDIVDSLISNKTWVINSLFFYLFSIPFFSKEHFELYQKMALLILLNFLKQCYISIHLTIIQ